MHTLLSSLCAFSRRALILSTFFVLPFSPLFASRFPQPQFDSVHQVPQAVHPPFAEKVPAWADVLILAAALAFTVWLVRKKRSRPLILSFSLLCLAWFGFARHGCICPVGSVQNVAVSVCHGGGLPWHVAAIFALPLLTALFFGRLFCGTVCPLGALQELFIIRPLRVPKGVDAVLRILPLAVLAFGVVYAVNGAGYLICRTDPFVGIFRRSAPLPLLLTGMAVLLLGMVVARPYCRYFCPYGVLLELCARIAWKPVAITDAECVNCRLCVGTCPVDAINVPRPPLNDSSRVRQFKRFIALLIAAPFIAIAFAVTGWLSGSTIAKAHPAVRLAEMMQLTEDADADDVPPEIEAFKRDGADPQLAQERSALILRSFRVGSAWAGFFTGIVLALRLLSMTRLPRNNLHETDRMLCIACGRCFPACPKNHQLQNTIKV
ncbi:MAG: 4Fe-4S binding protein [Kiritimatiellae bacterium]|nr:4Fe-4S binding protein [Kiritimatiellia bacterium]